jgi:transmembrane sensor
MDSSRLTFLFYRYINKSCTNAEKTEFLNYVSDSHHDLRLTELLDKLWMEAGQVKMPRDRSEVMLQHVLECDGSPMLTAGRDHRPLWWARVAASLLLVALCGSLLFYLKGNDTLDQLPTPARESYQPMEPRYIKLPDGSSVILNEGSHLQYPASFNDATRQVSLTGEAFFDIAHDPKRPFVVHTGKLMTTVLGTAFNIKAYPDQSDIVVTVTRGKVKVSDDKKVLGIINPHQQITFNRMHEYADQKVVDSHSVTAWMEKDIFFDDITIGDAIDQLQKRFGVAIIPANENIMSCKFTATFVKGEDLEQILQILCDFNNATLLQNDSGGFMIQGGECPL